MEHILPKKKSKGCTPANGTSNDNSKRRHTLGYPQYTFEPKNLAVSCKQCNTAKGTYDPIKDRTLSYKNYPRTGTPFSWVHPHFHRYSEHINLNEDFVFLRISDEGERVIEECQLDKAEVLEKKFFARAKARARQSDTIKDAIDYLVSSVKAGAFGKAQAMKALEAVFYLTSTEASELFSRFSSCKRAHEKEAAFKALKVIEGRLRKRRHSGSNTKSALGRAAANSKAAK